MKTHKNISKKLAAASCALLGVANSPLHADSLSNNNEFSKWDIKAAILFYSETQNRVQAVEPVVEGIRWIDTDESLTFKLVLDSLTGASPNGAVPTDFVQTFTGPSGSDSYQIKAGETPLDNTFKDSRAAISVAWDRPISRMDKVNLSANISSETDYRSLSTGAVFSHDMNGKNTTLSAGVSLADDMITPHGSFPTPFSEMQDPVVGESESESEEGGESKTKKTADFLLGLTQVIDRNSLVQFNYSLSQSNGYQTDPYKVISVVNDSDGRPEILSSSSINLSRVLYENRPDTRKKQSFYIQYKRYFNSDVLDTSYRYLWDDWGLKSKTIDMHYRFKLNAVNYWQPHVRYYQQDAVDFYTPFLKKSDVDSSNLPQYASADFRLSAFDAYTVGLEYGYKKWKYSAEIYQQKGKEPAGKFGELLNQNLATDLTAIMFRVNYEF